MRIDRRAWLFGMSLALVGCTNYPEASGQKTMLLLSALRTACSSRRLERLEPTARAIQNAPLTPEERRAFNEIIAMAKRGEWAEAEEACIKFQMNQKR